MPRKRKLPGKYTYHLMRALVALIAATIISWAIWKLLDMFLFPAASYISPVIGIAAGIILLTIDRFHLKDLE